MSIESAINLDDIRRLARRKLPRIAFDFIDGGADDERCLLRNRQAFERHCLVPRYLRDVSRREQSVVLFGRTYASPIGISPTGLSGLFRPDADLMLAAAAREAYGPIRTRCTVLPPTVAASRQAGSCEARSEATLASALATVEKLPQLTA